MGIVSRSQDTPKYVALFSRPCYLPPFNSLLLFFILLDKIHQHRFLYANRHSVKGEKPHKNQPSGKKPLL